MRNTKLTLAIICTAHILGMIPFSMYPTLIPTLQVEWGANNTEIGWVAGIYFGGYLLAVTILVPLTDRIDSRWVYLCSMALTAIIPLLFGFLTSGIISASVWRFLQGVGLAGTYMPGLKAMVDAVPDRMQSRTVAMYTMCFGLGVRSFISGSGSSCENFALAMGFRSVSARPAGRFYSHILVSPTFTTSQI